MVKTEPSNHKMDNLNIFLFICIVGIHKKDQKMLGHLKMTKLELATSGLDANDQPTTLLLR